MKVQSINIRMGETYEPNAGQYKGIVKMSDGNSTQEVAISARGISAIFRVIKEDIAAESMRIASATPRALDDAERIPLLLEGGDIKELPF